MNKIEVEIWGRIFSLDVTYHNYPGEDITSNQLNTAETISKADFADSLIALEEYMLLYYRDDLGIDRIDNIFKYVMPQCILIERDDKNRVFALMCSFKFDMEHGLAMVFENDKVKQIGPKDVVL